MSESIPRNPSLRVLVVEDSPADAALIGELMAVAQDGPLIAEYAEDLAQAVARLGHGDVDLVLLDLGLPDVLGLEAFDAIRARAPGVPVAILTGNDDRELAMQAVRRGAQDYLVKGKISAGLLERAIRYAVERFRVVAELRLQAEIIAHMGQGVCLVRVADAAFVYANPEFERMFGYAPGELIGQPVWTVNAAGEQGPEAAAAAIIAQLERDGAWSGEIENVRKDGSTFWCLANVSRFEHPTHGPIWIAIHADVTERKRLEEQLLQARKLETVGRLAGGVAHEFNNLLMVVTAHSRLLLDQIGPGDPVRRRVAAIARYADMAAALTDQLLSFGRRQPLQPRLLDLNESVAGLAELLHQGLGEDIALAIVPAPQALPVTVDPRQLEHALVQLAANARDAMPRGGSLRVELSWTELSAARARDLDLAPGGYAMLRLADTGPGMDPATAAQVFDPFFSTKDAGAVGQGAGLGLATVYGIIKQSGGHIEVESQPGRGTAFHLYLPLAEAAGPAGPAAPCTAQNS